MFLLLQRERVSTLRHSTQRAHPPRLRAALSEVPRAHLKTCPRHKISTAHERLMAGFNPAPPEVDQNAITRTAGREN